MILALINELRVHPITSTPINEPCDGRVPPKVIL